MQLNIRPVFQLLVGVSLLNCQSTRLSDRDVGKPPQNKAVPYAPLDFQYHSGHAFRRQHIQATVYNNDNWICFVSNRVPDEIKCITDNPNKLIEISIEPDDAIIAYAIAPPKVCAISRSHVYCGKLTKEGTHTRLSVALTASGKVYRDIKAGEGFFCLLDSNQSILCWGKNDRGQVGESASEGMTIDAAQTTTFPGDYKSIGLGRAHGCAIKATSPNKCAMVCWGVNDANQANANERAYSLPEEVDDEIPCESKLILGDKSTCYDIETDGQHVTKCLGDPREYSGSSPEDAQYGWVWKDSSYGCMTCLESPNSPAPTALISFARIRQSASSTIALHNDDTILCFCGDFCAVQPYSGAPPSCW